MATAESIRGALELSQQGADFVFLPPLVSAPPTAKVIAMGSQDGFEGLRADEIAGLRVRNEVLP